MSSADAYYESKYKQSLKDLEWCKYEQYGYVSMGPYSFDVNGKAYNEILGVLEKYYNKELCLITANKKEEDKNE